MRDVLCPVFEHDLFCDSHPSLCPTAIGAGRVAKRQIEDPEIAQCRR